MLKEEYYKKILLGVSLTIIISCGGGGASIPVNTGTKVTETPTSGSNHIIEKPEISTTINQNSLKLNKIGENVWTAGNNVNVNFGEKIGERRVINLTVKDASDNEVKVTYKTSQETLQDRVTNLIVGNPEDSLKWNEKNFKFDYRNLNNYTKGNKTEEGKEIDGTDVKIGIIDTGFENEGLYKKILKDKGIDIEKIFRAEGIYAQNSSRASHGIYVTATAAKYAPKAKFSVGDTTNVIIDGVLKAGNNESGIIKEMIKNDIKILNRSYGSEINTLEYKNFDFEKVSNMKISKIIGLISQVLNNGITKEEWEKKNGLDYEKFKNIYWDNLEILKKFVDNKGLIITAAGNKNNPDTKESDYNYTSTSVFYSTHKDLRKGMLNVGGIYNGIPTDEKGEAQICIRVIEGKCNYITDNGLFFINNIQSKTQGFSPATNLGKAKYGFMVAHSEQMINGVAYTGTSFATPVVTGAAALIKQKYPWMDGNLIRQTLITTATDIGEKGVDSVYGWGLLNIDKAVNGPALFSKDAAFEDNVTVNFDNYVSVFSNNIGGDAGLIKQGNGTLVLGGYNTYTGDTKVENGKLYVTNNMTSKIINDTPATTVLSGASVASVSNSGTLYSVGHNRVASLNSAPNSVIVADSDSKIIVENKSDLSNVNLKINVDKYVTKAGETNDYISGNVENKYNSVSAEGNYNVTNTEKGNVNISRASMVNVVAEGEESSLNVANNLDNVFDNLDKEVKAGVAKTEILKEARELQSMTASTRSSLQSLSGEIYASAQVLTFEQAQTINKDLSNRLNQIGMLDKIENGGYWLSGIGGKGKITKKGYASADIKTLGSMFGVDKKIGDNLILGGAIAYSNSDAKFDSNAGRSKSKSVNLSLYGRYGQKDNPVYVQGRLGIGFVDSDVERNVITGNITNSEKINHKDKVISAYVESGYDIKKGNFTFTPYVALEHDTVIRGKFKENSQFAINTSKKTYNQSNATVGLRGTQSFGAVKLNGYVEYKQALNKEDLSFNAKFNGINQDITVKGIGLNNNRTWAGVGIVHEVTPKFSWYGNYDLKLEKNKAHNNVFTIGFRANY